MPKYYRIEPKIRSDEEMTQEFAEPNIKAILIGWDAQAESGYDTPGTNAEIARMIKKFPDVFIGFWMNLPPVPTNQKWWKRFYIRMPRGS